MAGTRPPLGSTHRKDNLMGVQIGMCTSGFLPPGLYVAPNAQAALIANGWQPPETQEPTGSSFLPKEG